MDPAWLGGLLVDNQLEEAGESKNLSPALFGHHGERLDCGGPEGGTIEHQDQLGSNLSKEA